MSGDAVVAKAACENMVGVRCYGRGTSPSACGSGAGCFVVLECSVEPQAGGHVELLVCEYGGGCPGLGHGAMLPPPCQMWSGVVRCPGGQVLLCKLPGPVI